MDWQPRRLERWLADTLAFDADLSVTPLAGGVSNENYSLDYGHHRWVLRKAPAILSHHSAHNVIREYNIIKALEQTAVRVPRTILACDNRSVIGSPFFIMDRVNSTAIRKLLPRPYVLADDCVNVMSDMMIKSLVDIHNTQWSELFPEDDIGKPKDYLEQQIRRWLAQHQTLLKGAEGEIESLAQWLNDNRPKEQEITLIHGDFQLANMLFSAQLPTRLLAIVDWELASLGDPLVDLASVLLSWPARGNSYGNSLLASGKSLRSEATFQQLANQYANSRGCDISTLNFYLVLAAWKQAIIMESRFNNLQNSKVEYLPENGGFEGVKLKIQMLIEQAICYAEHPVKFV